MRHVNLWLVQLKANCPSSKNSVLVNFEAFGRCGLCGSGKVIAQLGLTLFGDKTFIKGINTFGLSPFWAWIRKRISDLEVFAQADRKRSKAKSEVKVHWSSSKREKEKEKARKVITCQCGLRKKWRKKSVFKQISVFVVCRDWII